ncbi:MAG: KH domain-containing protein [Acidimicrobiales bacterium]|nr:KH domain-containing protein [Acidimicrobiales bacterium]
MTEGPVGGTTDDPDADELDEVDHHNRVPAATARNVLEYLVRELVDDPDSVRIEVDESRRKPQLNVYVAQGDMGRVIGKRGRVAQAIRQVVRAAAVKDGTDVDIEFVD